MHNFALRNNRNNRNNINNINNNINVKEFLNSIEHKINNLNNIKLDNNYKVAILIPTTNKGRNWSKPEDTYIFNKTIKTLLDVTNDHNNIIFYIGVDVDDSIWLKQKNYEKLIDLKKVKKNIDFKLFRMTNISPGHVTEMWNKLFKYAYNDNCDYFLQCGDDIIFKTTNIIDDSIRMLKMHNDIGLTGPICNNPNILTQTFVSRKHMEIFNYYFPSQIKNWFCDDWINLVYSPTYYYPLLNHKCLNSGGSPRYSVEYINSLQNLVNIGKNSILRYLNNK